MNCILHFTKRKIYLSFKEGLIVYSLVRTGKLGAGVNDPGVNDPGRYLLSKNQNRILSVAEHVVVYFEYSLF